MKNFKFLFFFYIFTLACSSDDVNETPIDASVGQNKVEFLVNGQKPVYEIRNLSSILCCNDNLYVSFNHWIPTTNGLGYGGDAFTMQLDKNGNLLALYYNDFTHLDNEFYSPFFTPISTLNMENFEFIEGNLLKFRVVGQIFKKTYNFFAIPEYINIDAKFEIRKFNPCGCGSFPNRFTNVNDFIFHSITKRQQGSDIKYFAFTNNGYHIEFLNFNQSFKDMNLGVYHFDESSTGHRIDFRKFIGVPRAFSNEIISQEWHKYETSGNFEIVEKNQLSNGEVVVKIRFNLVVKQNNNVVIEFNNAILETSL